MLVGYSQNTLPINGVVLCDSDKKAACKLFTGRFFALMAQVLLFQFGGNQLVQFCPIGFAQIGFDDFALFVYQERVGGQGDFIGIADLAGFVYGDDERQLVFGHVGAHFGFGIKRQ